MEDINWRDIAEQVFELEGIEQNRGVVNENACFVIDAMIEFAKLACEAQKKICAEHGTLLIYDYDENGNPEIILTMMRKVNLERNTYIAVDPQSIRNTPTVKFDQMTKQELARKRNWFKFQISGNHLMKYHPELTEEETLLVTQAQQIISKLKFIIQF